MILQGKKIKYPEYLATLFSTTIIVGLSILCLLNSLSIDFYSTFVLLKVVLPAGVCAWIIGYVIGRILETTHVVKMKKLNTSDEKAYEIPSMFGSDSSIAVDNLDNIGDL